MHTNTNLLPGNIMPVRNELQAGINPPFLPIQAFLSGHHTPTLHDT